MRARIVAHRGGAGLRPENTLAACAYALALGTDGLEVDVRLSRDGEVVVFHDAVLDPGHVRGEGGAMIDGEPPLVRGLSLSQLKLLDVGYLRLGAGGGGASTVPGERIPTLGELLNFLDGFPAIPLLLIELKTDFETASPLDPVELTEAVLDILGPRIDHGSVRLMSFDWRCLVHAMKGVPAGACVFLTAPQLPGSDTALDIAPWFAGHAPGQYGGSAVKAISALGGRHWGPSHRQLNLEAVVEAHAAGLEVATWTVNEPRHLMRMEAFGVDCLITDYPDRALTLRNPSGAAQFRGQYT